MGVDLDQKKGNVYRTFGADYYRRNLKALVKGNSQLDIDFENANEVMKTETNNFPEFANYIVNSNGDYRLNNNIGDNAFGGLNLNIDLGFNNNINNENNLGIDNIDINNNLDNDLNNNNGNNINEIKINNEDKKLESVENKPEAPPTSQPSNNEKTGDKKVDVNNKEDDDSAERRVKNAVKLSIIGLKKLGKFMKKSGIKGYDLAKKYCKASVKVASDYVKNNFQKKNKGKDKEEEQK